LFTYSRFYFFWLLWKLDSNYRKDCSERNRRYPNLGVLILSVAFLLIVDLDRAQEGFLRIPQQAMLDPQRQLNSMP
jgi:hypothetical protein